MGILLLAASLFLVAAAETEKALNNVDVGFFLLLDKKDEPKKAQPINNVDVGFFLLLDKKDEPKKVKALNNVDVGFFLLLDKKDGAPIDEVELGRQLFFDPRLSANKTMSCASCHNPGMAWSDGLPRARGIDGRELLRNTPTLLNVHHNQLRFFWDGRADSVEQASLEALTSRLEMNRDLKELTLDVTRIPDYARKFTSLYGPDGVTPENIARAIAVFVRTEIRPAETAFERYREDKSALSQSALRGLELFAGKGRCVQCHTGPGLSNGAFHNTGVKQAPGREDAGRWAVNQSRGAWRAFKTVPLRNVALTAPYMHDGSIPTLREVIEFYDRGGDVKEDIDPAMKPLNLSQQDKDDLVAFLQALTSEQKPVAVPMLPVDAQPTRPEQAEAWATQRLSLLEHNAKKKQTDSIYANATVMAETLAALDGLTPRACHFTARQLAEQLAFAAKGNKPAGELRAGVKRLKTAWEDCRPHRPVVVPETRRASLKDIDKVLVVTEKIVRDLENPGKPVCSQVPMTKLMKDMGAGVYPESVVYYVMHDAIEHYQYRALSANDPRICDELTIDKVYAGLKRTAAWGCREWYWDVAAARALTTKSRNFEDICRQSVAHDYPSLKGEDGVAICGAIQRNIDKPKEMCDELAKKYLGPETLQACMNEFSRYSSEPYLGETQQQIPDLLAARYLALDRYVKAYRAKDTSKCEDSELCHALMGGADHAAKRFARKVSDAVCQLNSYEQLRARMREPGPMLEESSQLLERMRDAAPPSDLAAAATVDERIERVARLRLRYLVAMEKRKAGQQ